MDESNTDELALAALADSSKTILNGVTPKAPRTDIEVGVTDFLPFTTPYENAWQVYRNDQVTPEQLVAMRRTDGQARALHRLIVLPIRAALTTCTFVPPAGIKGGTKEAEFVQQLFTLPPSSGGMLTPWPLVIAQALNSVFDGFSPFELVYWSPKKGPLKGKWTLKKMAYRSPSTVYFLLDQHGDFYGFRQRCMFMGRSIDVPIGPDSAVYIAMQEEERRFYGYSFFESAFYHWDKKVRLYFVAHLAAQRAATGTRVGQLPASPKPEERAQFVKSLSDLGFAQYLAVPDGYSVNLMKEGTQFDFLAFINHHNSQMSKSVLAPFFDEQQGSGGDTTLVDFGQQSDAMFILMLDTIMAEVESFINDKIIPRFIDWNFDSGIYPKFRFGQLTAEQKGVLTDMFKTLAVISTQYQSCTPEFMHEMEKQVAEELGLEIDYESVEARLEESAKLAAAEAAQASTATPPNPDAPPSQVGSAQQPQTPSPGEQPRQAREGAPVVPPAGSGVPGSKLPRVASGAGQLKTTAESSEEDVTLAGLARELLLDSAGPPVSVKSLADLNRLMNEE